MPEATANTQSFAEVVLPLALPQNQYTYGLSTEQELIAQPGQRVIVALGKRKLYTGVILFVHQKTPPYNVKLVEEILDESPIISAQQITLWHWLANYYLCSLGEVMNAALPAGLKIQSQTLYVANPTYTNNWSNHTDNEFLLLEAMAHQPSITLQDAAQILGVKNPSSTLNRLLLAGAILTQEELKKNTHPKVYTTVWFTKNESETEQIATYTTLKNAPKQAAIYRAILDLKNSYKDQKIPVEHVLKQADANRTALNSLVKKNIVELHKQLEKPEEISAFAPLELNEDQQRAKSEIKAAFAENRPVLLHGVTASGKTEIYISLIKEALQNATRALFLVPEIALTTQLINRLQHHFGETVLIYHSRISASERLAAYQLLHTSEKPLVVLGARSSLLLPLHDIGIVVVDEEHDPSYKQHDPAPRYNARDAALVLAKQNKCPIILGSATPSAESYYLAQKNTFAYITLNQRYGGVRLPKISAINIRKETLWKQMRGHFSEQLLNAIKQTLAQGKKAILFQNRRGYTPVVQCASCGHIQKCSNCDISLTYHKYTNQLTCHYCGYHTQPPAECPKCKSTHLKELGFGTEKIEEELQLLLPDAKISRLDLDTTRKKNAFNKLIAEFETGNIDILIGTQMVTKGLDFTDVQLVGVLNADNSLYYPDFRAQERAYQLMAQVAGRAGRRNERGNVLIQSYQPEHQIIRHVLANDYKTMISEQIREREIFSYPPYTRLISIDFKHRSTNVLDTAAEFFASHLRNQLPNMVLGPEYPPTKRLKGFYYKSILLKLDKKTSAKKVKAYLKSLQITLQKQPAYRQVRCIFNVDPY